MSEKQAEKYLRKYSDDKSRKIWYDSRNTVRISWMKICEITFMK